LSDEAKSKLQQQWKHRQYLIIDEYSMISKSFLALLSRNISIAKEGSQSYRPDHSFGGSAAESLFTPLNALSDSRDRNVGRLIYEEFETVVILKEQMRVTDPVWQDLLTLHHLRHGCAHVDFAQEPWCNASLVTPRHAVRHHWNEAASHQWCVNAGERLYVCTAEDTIGGQQLSWAERYAVAGRGKKERKNKRKDLPWRIELARGMKILVTDNIETDLDVTNGAHREIVNIILHPDEPPIGEEPIVVLKMLPSYLLVKLARTRA
ncbi:hypothetical protein M378DRAFT_58263, partial [Amanita muscaria Koide BX008]